MKALAADQKSPLAVWRAEEMTVHFSHSWLADWLPVTPTMCFCLRGAHPCAKPYYAQATKGRGGVCMCVCGPLTGVGTESGSCNLEIMLVAHFLAVCMTCEEFYYDSFYNKLSNMELLHKADVFWH